MLEVEEPIEQLTQTFNDIMRILPVFVILIAVTTGLQGQSIDKVFMYNGEVVSGRITSNLIPLKRGRMNIQTKEGDRIILIDEIDSLKKDDVYYQKLSFKVGNKSYQALGKRYFQGSYSLYDVSVEGLAELQLLQKNEIVVPIFANNYEQTFRAVLDRSYTGSIQLQSFKPVYLSRFSENYHNELGIPYSEYILYEKMSNRIQPFIGVDFLKTRLTDEGRFSEYNTSNRYNIGAMIKAKRFQFIPYLSFGSTMISSTPQYFDGEYHSLIDEKIKLNGFGLATNLILIKDWYVEPYLQGGFLYVNAKTDLTAGELVWNYDQLANLFFGCGFYKDFGRLGASFSYQIRNSGGDYRVFRDAGSFKEAHQSISVGVFVAVK